MLYRLTSFFLLLFFLQASAQSKKSFDLKKIDVYLQQLVSGWKIAGCAVGIVYKDSLIFSKGYGFRDIQNKLPVTPNTLFLIGSNTKLFTAVSAAILHGEKKLDLDKPVRTYMPSLQFPTAELNEKLTLKDMLSHRAGVPRWDGVWFHANDTEEELLGKLQYLFPTRGLRESLLYNNHYYSAAGMICGKIYGTNYKDLVTKKLFAPLEMVQSGFDINNAPQGAERGNDYIFAPGKNQLVTLSNADYFCRCVAPAGLIVSNINDLSHWVIALLNKGIYKGRQVIPSAAIEETIRPNNIGLGRYRYNEMVDAGYGLGRNISFYKGHYFLFHGGSAGGYRTEISFFPNDSIGIIVLNNTVQGQYMASAAVLGIADRLLKLDETSWSERHKLELDRQISNNKKQLDSLRSLQVTNTTFSHPISDYTGTYESRIYGTITITLDSGQLNLHYRNVNRPLDHFHYDQFWTRELPEYSVYPQLYPVYRLNFFSDNKGRIFKFQTSIIGDPETEFVKRF